MVNWILLVVLQGLYWTTGNSLFKICLPTSTSFSFRRPDWFTSYFLGLVLNVIVAFFANQFCGIRLSLFCLIVIAALLCGVCLLLQKYAPGTPLAIPKSERWTVGQFTLLGLIVIVFARRYALDIPMAEYDAFMYHLPFGQLIREGSFPSDIGRSYTQQMESAYPPLFYFICGLTAHIDVPKATYLAPRLVVIVVDGLSCVVTYHFARDCMKLQRSTALASVFLASLLINCHPNLQRASMNIQSMTTLYFMMAMYYSWSAFSVDQNGRRNRSFVLAALFWSGCYWNNYLGLPLAVLFFLGLGAGAIWTRVTRSSSKTDFGQRVAGVERSEPPATEHLGAHFVRPQPPKPSIDTASRESVEISFRKYVIAACIVGAFIGLHMLRNWMSVGNPIYPALLDVLGGSDITEWYLANRPPAAMPIDKDWRYISTSLAIGRPMTHLLLAGTAAMMFPSQLHISRRILIATLLGGFLVAWFEVLHLQLTPIYRYLYPVTPLAACAVISHLVQIWNQRSISLVVSGAYLTSSLLLLVVTVMQHPHAPGVSVVGNKIEMFLPLIILQIPITVFGFPLVHVLIKRFELGNHEQSGGYGILVVKFILACVSFVWIFLMIFAPLYESCSFFVMVFFVAFALMSAVIVRVFSSMKTNYHSVMFAATIISGCIVFASYFDWQQATGAYLPIEEDIYWMNTNLTDRDRVLVFESRLFTLQKQYIPMDDYQLEAFAKTDSTKEALAELDRLKITHFYYSHPAKGLSLSDVNARKSFLFPRQNDEYFEIVHESQTGWVARRKR